LKYEKRPLSFEAQADQLLERGLVASRQELIDRLQRVNYYRLTGYLHPFRQRDAAGKLTDSYLPGTSLQTIWRRYNFDRRLRMVILDAIERIEVAVRSQFVYRFTHVYGPFGYLDPKNLPGFKQRPWWKRTWRNSKALLRLRGTEQSDYDLWLGKLRREKSRSNETFVKHFVERYGDCHDYLPLWMACELMTCETTLQFVYGVDRTVIKQVAADFGFPDEQLLSWTKAIFALRNGCAHHSRIWNRVHGAKPSIPGKNKHPDWHITPGFTHDRTGLLLTVCHYWLGKVSPTTQWKDRLFALFDEYPEIPIAEMGLPPDWRTHKLWQNAP
jgi:abortive infection bacteriophage resistance protein